MYFGYFISKINKKILTAKYIRGMYFLHKPINLRPKIDIIHKNYSMNIMNIKINLWDSCKRISLRKGRINKEIDKKHVYEAGKQKISKDFSLFNIVQTISKLKASVGALVGENKSLFIEIEKNFFRDSMIFINDEDHQEHIANKT
jgi:hypothetical protein